MRYFSGEADTTWRDDGQSMAWKIAFTPSGVIPNDVLTPRMWRIKLNSTFLLST